ncbi:MAG: NAD-dependent DNA ligase LigA [Clostridiales bacterium]|jgi:DNA ligase (NAD+)|nr:NAD-dependent DNA ligase LigA [Clostridiales bacterium]
MKKIVQDKKESSKKMQQLVAQLKEYAIAYYTHDNPMISDAQYDLLYDELVALEQSTGIVLSDSPTSKVGADIVKTFEPHVHLNKLYSLDKVNSFEELQEWALKVQKKINDSEYGSLEDSDAQKKDAQNYKIDKEQTLHFTLEYKVDGLTLCLTYDDGILKKAATRGNGTVGETVTSQVKAMLGVPQKIDYKGLWEVQGEGYIKLSDLNEYNKTATALIKNARNGVAGAIRNLDTDKVVERKADILFYNINFNQDDSITTHMQALGALKANGFNTLLCKRFDNIEDVIKEIKCVDREKLDFLIDGMVVKVDDFVQRQILGYTDKFPRWAVAFKFKSKEITTTVIDVIWQVGRTGKLTPMAILQPVDIDGATVSRATLNNFDDILRKDVGIGSTVFIRRSNDVIPEVLYGVQGSSKISIILPTNCPCCNFKVQKDGVNLFCVNALCPKIICGKIEHFVSRDAMDIEGISEKTIQLLYEKKLVQNPIDLFKLSKSDLKGLQGFADKKIDNLLQNIQNSKTVPLHKFLHSLGINGVGKKTAKDLQEHFGNIDNLMNTNIEYLQSIPDIGQTMSQNIVDYFANKENFAHLQEYKSILSFVTSNQASDGKLNHKKFVITGTLSNPRAHFVTLITDNGGKVSDSVSKDTDYLLAGEGSTSKLDKAKKLGIQILSQSEFENMLKN